jgi:hypothetical protein
MCLQVIQLHHLLYFAQRFIPTNHTYGIQISAARIIDSEAQGDQIMISEGVRERFKNTITQIASMCG